MSCLFSDYIKSNTVFLRAIRGVGSKGSNLIQNVSTMITCDWFLPFSHLIISITAKHIKIKFKKTHISTQTYSKRQLPASKRYAICLASADQLFETVFQICSPLHPLESIRPFICGVRKGELHTCGHMRSHVLDHL